MIDYKKRKEEREEFKKAKKENPELLYVDWYMNKIGNPEPTQVIHIEGVGTAKQYGELDLEKLVKRLLKSEAITGIPQK
jgi:hypothetical protein